MIQNPTQLQPLTAEPRDDLPSTPLRIESVTIRDFRNLASLDVTMPPDGVVIIGENGMGKTNFLEAIYYLVLFRSLRGASDRELVRFGQRGFFVAATAGTRVTAGFEVNGARKKVTVDQVPVNRLAEAVGHLVAVPFSPGDREIVSGGPAGRRRYLDILLALSSPAYMRHLTSHRAVTRQRNAALRRADLTAARAFDRTFAEEATRVALHRSEWVVSSAERFRDICAELGERQVPSIRYRPRGWDPTAGVEALTVQLAAHLDQDARQGATSIGPHRDDVALVLGDRPLRRYGSAGQQRTAAIALRILEGETIFKATGLTPIALYDDVFVELDQNRQERLLSLIRDSLPGQWIITAPRESEVPKAVLDRPRWTMSGGTLAAA